MSLRKELISLSVAPIFVTAARGQLYIAWHWCPLGLTLVGPLGLGPTEKVLLNTYDIQGTARSSRLRSLVFL